TSTMLTVMPPNDNPPGVRSASVSGSHAEGRPFEVRQSARPTFFIWSHCNYGHPYHAPLDTSVLVCESRTIWCSLRQQERHFFGAVYQAGDRRWGHVGPASGRADATASVPSGRRVIAHLGAFGFLT